MGKVRTLGIKKIYIIIYPEEINSLVREPKKKMNKQYFINNVTSAM